MIEEASCRCDLGDVKMKLAMTMERGDHNKGLVVVARIKVEGGVRQKAMAKM